MNGEDFPVAFSASETRPSEKRPSSDSDYPAVKRIREEGEMVDANATSRLRPTLKNSESHGISEYVSKAHNGFFGILKHRISDFIVNEIDGEGNVVKLTDMSCDVAETPIKDNNSNANDNEEAISKLKTEIGEENYEKITNMVIQNTAESSKGNDEKDGDEEENDKKLTSPAREVVIRAPEGRDARTSLHALLRAAFPALESQTDDAVSEDGTAFIKIIRVKFLIDCLMAKAKGKSRGFLHPGGKRVNKWPKDLPEFCHFVLYKENTDTMDAINVVSGNLGMKTNVFVFSGTKDRRAITSQRVSVQKVYGQRLLALNKKLKCIKVGNFEYKKLGLKMGDNWGNQFRLVLRSLKNEEREAVEIALNSLAEAGYINYYGMQRFGSTEISTHSIGLALLRREWLEAIDLILKPRPNDRRDMAECRKTWMETRDPQKANEKLGRKKCPEKCLLSGLSKHGPKNDFCGALNWIPRTTRLMYVHAYQSHIWNHTVSLKIAKHGLTAQAGDLVATRKVGGEKIEREHVKVLKVEEESLYDIYDVVLPLVGHDVLYPDNESKDWMLELFTKDGLTWDSFNSSVRDYALPGGYRHILIKPKDLEWKMVEYAVDNEPLNSVDDDEIVESAFLKKGIREEIKGETPSGEEEEKEENKKEVAREEESKEISTEESMEVEPEVDDPAIDPGQSPLDNNDDAVKTRLAVVMKFALPSSCYATMAIRELTRMDVSSGFQATLM